MGAGVPILMEAEVLILMGAEVLILMGAEVLILMGADILILMRAEVPILIGADSQEDGDLVGLSTTHVSVFRAPTSTRDHMIYCGRNPSANDTHVSMTAIG